MIQLTKNVRFSAMKALVVLAVALSAGTVSANEPAAPTTSSAPGKDHPCRSLRKAAIEACQASKFEKGKHKDHKGLFKDCVRPIMDGKTVEGVSVDATLLQACQSKKAKRGQSAAPAATE